MILRRIKKYCDYHEVETHNIRDCNTLKNIKMPKKQFIRQVKSSQESDVRNKHSYERA